MGRAGAQGEGPRGRLPQRLGVGVGGYKGSWGEREGGWAPGLGPPRGLGTTLRCVGPTATSGEGGPLSLFPRPPPPSHQAPRAEPTISTAGRLKSLKHVTLHINLANPVHHPLFWGTVDK